MRLRSVIHQVWLGTLLLPVFTGCDAPAASSELQQEEREPRGKSDAPLPGSCADSCGGPSQSGSCWCDDLCEQYGDCCVDMENICNPELPPEEEAALLELVNHVSVAFLEHEVGISTDAAAAMVARRRGPDGIELTADDARFVSAEDVRTVAEVDAEELAAMRAFAYPLPAFGEYLPLYSTTLEPIQVSGLRALECTKQFCGANDWTQPDGNPWLSLELHNDLSLKVNPIAGSTELESSGDFVHYDHWSGCGTRSCFSHSASVSGHLSPFGTVTITSYTRASQSGNQALGFTYRKMKLAQPVHISLHELDQ